MQRQKFYSFTANDRETRHKGKVFVGWGAFLFGSGVCAIKIANEMMLIANERTAFRLFGSVH